MELEQFKNIWAKETGPEQKQDEYFLSLLGKRSNSPITRMKRNLQHELFWIIILYTSSVLFYFLAFEGKMKEIAWVMLVVGLLFLVYYYRKNKLLNSMQCVSCHVRSNLELQLSTLEKYVRFYLIAGNILCPLILIAVGYVAFILYPERMHMPKNLNSTNFLRHSLVWYIIMTVVLSVFCYFLNKWYVNRLYGRHIKKLREILNEMKE